MIVQLFMSLSPTNSLPSALIFPITSTVPLGASAFMLSFFMVSWAKATPKLRMAAAKQIVISFFILISLLAIVATCRPQVYASNARRATRTFKPGLFQQKGRPFAPPRHEFQSFLSWTLVAFVANDFADRGIEYSPAAQPACGRRFSIYNHSFNSPR